MAPIYTNFEGRARAKKTQYFAQNFFKKMAENTFIGLFFQIFGNGAKNLAKTESFYMFGRAWKINFFDLKNLKLRSTKFFVDLFRQNCKFCEKPPLPRENYRSAHV